VNGERPKILYVINTGKSRAGHSLERLLDVRNIELTITTGRNAAAESEARASIAGIRQSRANTRLDQRNAATAHVASSPHRQSRRRDGPGNYRCGLPMIINQVIPGQEEGNAHIIEMLEAA